MINLPKAVLASCAGAALLAVTAPSGAQPTYGSQLMTPEERAVHRSTMRGMPPADRQAYRQEHHEAMQRRAEEMGTSLPDRPPMGPGRGGMGPGYGGPGYGGGGPGYGGPGYGHGGPGYGRGGPGHGYGGRDYGRGGHGYRGGGRDYGRYGNRGRFRNWDRNRFRYGRGGGPGRY